ncbi:hypothetical protein KIN20_031422, partial [Parelaphostrongylus tenuis]
MDHLRNAHPNSSYVTESFDVDALYTNVSNAIRELLIQHQEAINTYGLSNQQLTIESMFADSEFAVPDHGFKVGRKAEATIQSIGNVFGLNHHTEKGFRSRKFGDRITAPHSIKRLLC